jgi:hypothetical protein
LWFGFGGGSEVNDGSCPAEHAIEEAVLLLKVAADGVRHQVPTAETVGGLVAFPIDEYELFGLAYGEGVEKHLVDERVDGSGGSDAEREGKGGGDGEGGSPEEGAGGVTEVVEEVAEPAGEPDVADFLLDMREWAEFEGGLAAGCLLGKTGAHEVGNAAVCVIGEFAVQTLF